MIEAIDVIFQPQHRTAGAAIESISAWLATQEVKVRAKSEVLVLSGPSCSKFRDGNTSVAHHRLTERSHQRPNRSNSYLHISS